MPNLNALMDMISAAGLYGNVCPSVEHLEITFSSSAAVDDGVLLKRVSTLQPHTELFQTLGYLAGGVGLHLAPSTFSSDQLLCPYS